MVKNKVVFLDVNEGVNSALENSQVWNLKQVLDKS